MASVGQSVKKAIDDWQLGELDFAMLHACNAVDGTSKKHIKSFKGNKDRFTKFLRINYDILGPMGMPGINIVETRWPIKISSPTKLAEPVDLADVIYCIHRCAHGHGDELPDGFELIPNASGPARITQSFIAPGRINLSDRIIFGLLACAVVSPENVTQKIPNDYFLSFAGIKFPISELWGRKNHLLRAIATESLPHVTLDFSNLK